MKKILSKLILAITALSLISCSAASDYQVHQYSEKIVEMQNEVTQALDDYFDAAFLPSPQVSNVNGEKLDEKYTYLIKVIEKNITDLKGLKIIDGGEDLKNTVLELFYFYQNTAKNNFKTLNELAKKGKNMNDNELEKMNEIMTDYFKKKEELDRKFSKAHESFAKKHGFILIP